MTSGGQGGEQPFDPVASEFGDQKLGAPSSASLDKMTIFGKKLVAGTEAELLYECALSNGEHGFVEGREDTDFVHIEQHKIALPSGGHKPDPDRPGTTITWHRGSFEGKLEGYTIEDGEVTSHRPYALTMPEIDEDIFDGQAGDEEDEEAAEAAYRAAHTRNLVEQLKAVGGTYLDPSFTSLDEIIPTLLTAAGTSTQLYNDSHPASGGVDGMDDRISVVRNERAKAPEALQIAPKLSIVLRRELRGSNSDFDVLRILENGAAEYEQRRIGPNRIPAFQQSDGSLGGEVVRRRNAQQAALAERQAGMNLASQEQVDRMVKDIGRMWSYIRWPSDWPSLVSLSFV